MKENVVIIGCVGTARNIIEQIIDAELNYNNNLHLVGVCIDSLPLGTNIEDVPVLARTNEIQTLLKETNYKFIFALFKPELLDERLNLLKSYNIPSDRWINFIHPRAWVANTLKLGVGNIILSNTSIMTKVVLGNFNTINSGIIIEHGVKIGEGNFIAAGSIIGSDVRIGNSNFIGLNTTIRENVVLGNSVYAGMGSLILDDFNTAIIYGQPAARQNS